MADSRDRSGTGSAGGGASLLLSTIAGAALGAAGLAWWLRSEAKRRRHSEQAHRLLRLSRLQAGTQQPLGGAAVSGAGSGAEPGGRPPEGQLHDRVQQLNQAIDEVRRQLEDLQPQP